MREVLLCEGQDCPVANIVRIDLAAAHLLRPGRSSVVIVVLRTPERRWRARWRMPRRTTPGAVLAVGPGRRLEAGPPALRRGADDYVDEADLEAELEARLSRLAGDPVRPGRAGADDRRAGPQRRQRLEHPGRQRRHRPGQGAQAAALIDLKLETGDLAALLDLKPTYTLADLCQNVARMDRSMFERSLVRHASGVHLLAPPADASPTPGTSRPRGSARPWPGPGRVPLRGGRPRPLLPRGAGRRSLRDRPTWSCSCSGSTSPRCGTPGGRSTTWSIWASPGAGPPGRQPLRAAQGSARRQGRGGPGHEDLPLRPRRPQDRQPGQQQRRPGVREARRPGSPRACTRTWPSASTATSTTDEPTADRT